MIRTRICYRRSTQSHEEGEGVMQGKMACREKEATVDVVVMVMNGLFLGNRRC